MVAAAAQGGEDSAESLNLRIVRAGEGDPDLPNPAADLQAERVTDKVIVSGDQLVFEDNIYLPDAKNPKALFLVWSENWRDARIQSASVEHRLESERNEPVGAPERRSALYDQATRRWYLPFSVFFSSDSEGADPARQHLLIFDFQMSDGTRRLVPVRLRVIGAVPRLHLEEQDAGVGIATTPSEGIVVRRSLVANPAHRPLKLWLKAVSPEPLRLKTYLGHITFRQEPSFAPLLAPHLAMPVANPVSWYKTQAALEVTELRVIRAGAKEMLRVDATAPAQLELGADEKVELQWVARGVAGQAHCVLPPTQVRHLSWWNGANTCAGTLICLPEMVRMMVASGDFSEPWYISGGQISGLWQEELSDTNPWDGAPVETSRLPHPVSRIEGLLI